MARSLPRRTRRRVGQPGAPAISAHHNTIANTVARTLSAIEAAEPRLNATVAVLRDVALAEAAHRDALAKAGVNLGPLHGVPIAVKDIIDVAGTPTSAGTAARKAPPPAARDACVVARLRAAGAIVVAKTKTVEFAYGGWGTNDSQGTPHNPWHEEPHAPGGSSSGTGVLVGAGLVPAGLGTDTGGSVRIPAAFCGTVGLKTSVGRVSRAGVVPLSTQLDSVGPLTDTVERAAQMLAVMQGEDPADPSTIGIPMIDPMAELERGVAGLTIGVVAADQLQDMTEEVAHAFAIAVKELEAAGARTLPFRLPRTFLEMQTFATRIIASDAYAEHHALVDDPAAPLNTATRKRLTVGRNVSARQRIEAERAQTLHMAEFDAAMDRLDAILLPTAPHVSIPLRAVDEDNFSMSLYTRLANYISLAALSVPSGIAPSGLPTSLQIVTRRFEDALALRIGRSFELARGPFPAPPAIG